ncbi:midkine a isoform X1 [Tachysurus fulvidraco]|uniref:midkine a isoform X1 n=2 Tax=Tachysurus fulvidraco TaxID=1234273 RepID=UPI001FEF546C|nr:midkine a isoform X1 [Tachysurus fulvidraco]
MFGSFRMRGLFSTIFLLLVALMIVTTEAGKNKKDKGKGVKGASDCTDWRFGNCVANNGDCGSGMREGTCNDQIKKLKCKVPCNWKKDFGADCKYKFEIWGECDAALGMKSRTGTLQKALYHAECQPVITVQKPCSTKNKAKSKGKKGKGKGN